MKYSSMKFENVLHFAFLFYIAIIGVTRALSQVGKLS